MKKCKKCNIEKDEKEFSIRRNVCKKCRTEYACKNYRKREDEVKKRRKQRYNENREKEINQSKEYYTTHREQRLKYRKDNYLQNREKKIKKSTEYRNKNKEKIQEYNKTYFPIYRLLNKEKINKYIRDKRKNDPNFRISGLLRGRIKDFLKSNQRIDHTMNLLGCSLKFLKEYLQQTAIQNGYLDFNINDYSGKEYHIDHIIPCSSFNLSKEEEQRKCFHWSNLQILSSTQNLKKGSLTSINTSKESSNG